MMLFLVLFLFFKKKLSIEVAVSRQLGCFSGVNER